MASTTEQPGAAIPAHPLANLFPMLGAADAAALQADIAANGLRERIVVLDGQILDGRNRYRAAIGAGVIAGDPPEDGSDLWISHFRRFNPGQDGDPLAWVLSKNLHRRHLDDGQRAMIAERLATMGIGRPSKTDGNSANLRNISQADAAGMLNVSERSVTSARSVREHGAPELVEKVERGEVAVSAAAELATLPVGEQLRILREQHPREFGRAVREERAKTQAAKKDRRAERESELGARQMALPDKRYGVILEDPEWRFEVYSGETGMDRAADNHYPTSALAAIMARPVIDIAARDAVLLLWATVPMLPQALEVMAAHGFAYKSHFVWAKDRIGTGYWNRNQHELLLLGTRGEVPAPAMGDQWTSLQAAPVGAHSSKPAFAHELAEAYFPNLPKIELNARTRRAGWDAWGLETPQESPEAVSAQSEAIAMSLEQATPILIARYATTPGEVLAAEIGRPVNTIRSWAHRLGLTERARLASNGAHLGQHLKTKEGTS